MLVEKNTTTKCSIFGSLGKVSFITKKVILAIFKLCKFPPRTPTYSIRMWRWFHRHVGCWIRMNTAIIEIWMCRSVGGDGFTPFWNLGTGHLFVLCCRKWIHRWCWIKTGICSAVTAILATFRKSKNTFDLKFFKWG